MLSVTQSQPSYYSVVAAQPPSPRCPTTTVGTLCRGYLRKQVETLKSFTYPQPPLHQHHKSTTIEPQHSHSLSEFTTSAALSRQSGTQHRANQRNTTMSPQHRSHHRRCLVLLRGCHVEHHQCSAFSFVNHRVNAAPRLALSSLRLTHRSEKFPS